MGAASAAGRDPLDSRRGVALALLGALVILTTAGVNSPHVYGERAFVVDHVRVELVLAVWVGAVAAWAGARRIGWRRPDLHDARRLVPLLVLMTVAGGAWLAARASVPPQGASSLVDGWLLLRTTLLVGLNEETLFRGLLLAATVRWWGLRRGAIASTLVFGLSHFANVLAGAPPWQAALQVGGTTLIGSVFLLGALALRSVWPVALCHGLYDALVFDIGLMTQGGAAPAATLAVVLAGWAVGTFSLVAIVRLRDMPLYDDRSTRIP